MPWDEGNFRVGKNTLAHKKQERFSFCHFYHIICYIFKTLIASQLNITLCMSSPKKKFKVSFQTGFVKLNRHLLASLDTFFRTFIFFYGSDLWSSIRVNEIFQDLFIGCRIGGIRETPGHRLRERAWDSKICCAVSRMLTQMKHGRIKDYPPVFHVRIASTIYYSSALFICDI